MSDSTRGLRQRSELPWLIAILATLLGGWWALNAFVFRVYPPDPSEHGRFSLVRWGTDPNPARQEQVSIFNRAHRDQHIKVEVVPGAASMQAVITRSAANDAPEVIDAYGPEDLFQYAAKGIAKPLNPYLKETHFDPATHTWPALVETISAPNPAYRPGVDDPIDARLWYSMPNNIFYDLCYLNRTLYLRAAEEQRAAGRPVPPEPWVGWTWWDFAALAKIMQRHGADGRFVSFGATPPNTEAIAVMIGAGMRGEDRAGFDALDAATKAQRGLAGLSWDDCVATTSTAATSATAAGSTPTIWPNRVAITQALQFSYDLQNVIHAVPSQSDQQQMATGGGAYGGSGLNGQFLAGNCGMLIMGRWYLGQIRANVAFDWRLVRMPRWVPYAEWARWQREGKGPHERDGDWGDREHPDRGYQIQVGTRSTFLSSSARDPRQAFAFLRFIATDPDYNRLILLEDGAGADYAMSVDYMGKLDPLVPDELVKRSPEQELGAIRCQLPLSRWPWPNSNAKATIAWSTLPSWIGRSELATDALASGAPATDFPELGRFTGESSMRTSQAVGEGLAKRLCSSLDALAAEGMQMSRIPNAAPPSLRTIACLVAVLVLGAWLSAGVVMNARRRRRALDEPEPAHG